MSKHNCRDGKHWDKLLMACVRDRKPPPRVTRAPQPPLPRLTALPSSICSPTPTSLSSSSTTAPSEAPWSTQGYSVWTHPEAGAYWLALGSVVALGSVLVLVLWFLIYRRPHKRTNCLPPPVSELKDQPDPPAEILGPLVPRSYPEESVHEEPEPCCPHLDCHTGRVDFWHGNDITSCSKMLKPGLIWVGENGANGRKHRVPLPATEIGDTTLVTAKTGRNQ